MIVVELIELIGDRFPFVFFTRAHKFVMDRVPLFLSF